MPECDDLRICASPLSSIRIMPGGGARQKGTAYCKYFMRYLNQVPDPCGERSGVPRLKGASDPVR